MEDTTPGHVGSYELLLLSPSHPRQSFPQNSSSELDASSIVSSIDLERSGPLNLHDHEPRHKLEIDDSVVDEDRLLQPNSFTPPASEFNLWFNGIHPKASATGVTRGFYLDLRILIPVLIAVCSVAFIPLIVYLTLDGRIDKVRKSNSESPSYDCGAASIIPNGTLSGDLGINLIVFDHLSFTVAKAIDLAWNTLAGRGSQVLAAFMSYRMFMGMLYLSTEQRGISAETFATIALSNTKIWSYGPVIKTVCSNNLGVLHRLAYVWILISVIYLLLAGTMIDLMTGYQSGEATWFQLPNGTMLNMNTGLIKAVTDLQVTERYMPNKLQLWDGQNISPNWSPRASIHQPEAICITAYIPGDDGNATMLYRQCKNESYATIRAINLVRTENDVWNVPEAQYWQHGTYLGAILDRYPDSSCANVFNLQNVYVDSTGPICELNRTIWRDQKRYFCVPSTDYRWGFSYRYLWMLTTVNSVWLIITAMLWLYVELNSQLLQKCGPLGTWRAVLDLSAALRSVLGHHTGAYTEKELERAVKRLHPLTYIVCEDESTGVEKISLAECTANGSWQREKIDLKWKVKYS